MEPARFTGRVLCVFALLLEGDHSRHQPPFPHLIDLVLEVGDIFVGEMREPSLPEQVIADRQPLEFALRNLLRFAVKAQLPFSTSIAARRLGRPNSSRKPQRVLPTSVWRRVQSLLGRSAFLINSRFAS